MKPYCLRWNRLQRGRLTPGLPYRHVTTSPVASITREDLGSEQQFQIITASGSRYLITLHASTYH